MMVDPEKMFEEFEEDYTAECIDNEPGVDLRVAPALYRVVRFLKEILLELQAHRPVELEPVTVESYESRYPFMAGGLSLAAVRRFDEEVQRRMAELHAPGATETAHGVRLDLVKHTAVEDLNVAPQVAEYARRILMGCRPEPDRGVMDTLWGYVGQEVPEGYTLVDKRAAALLELKNRAVNDGVHPAAAELARRILAGEGPTVTVCKKVAVMIPGDAPMTPVGLADLEWCDVLDLNGPHTVLVVDSNVDLEVDDA